MLIVALSDTHNHHKMVDVPVGDVLIHAGDATNKGTEEELVDFFDWFSALPHQYKLLIPGNHDRKICGFRFTEWRERYPGIHILVHQGLEIEGVKFFGNASMWGEGIPINEIPPCDILITHTPPEGILDLAPPSEKFGNDEDEHIGNLLLTRHILKIKPRIHIAGHVHRCGGQVEENQGTTHYNVSICSDKPKIPVRGCALINYP